MPKKAAAKPKTYIDLLTEDHKRVKALFKKFEKTEDPDEKQEIVRQTLLELKVHAKLEEELVYPALRQVVEEDMMDEADEEHHVAKVLMAELEAMDPEAEHYDAKFTVLGEIVQHHAEEEESEMLPKGKKTNVEVITESLIERKQALIDEYSRETAGVRR